MARSLIAESDWLASSPYFYNLSSNFTSSRIWEVIPSTDSLFFHPEGLYNFLDFGYSVLGQTPLMNIRFLEHSSRLWKLENGTLEVESIGEPFDQYEKYCLSESDVIELIRDRVQTWEKSLPADVEIILPLSGGFDSRLLLWCLNDRSRIRAYTYGVSKNQSDSIEVVHARYLAKRFKLRWEQISLGGFHKYLDDWDAEFGLSTHAHGMYHFEFYAKIRKRLKGEQAFLSGIFGDVWAGSISPPQVSSSLCLEKLGYTHGLRADPTRLRFSVEHRLREKFWTDYRERIVDHRFQVVTTIRFKILLISYLLRVPKLFGFRPWTPYLDIDIAMAMLNLPQHRRANRQWQRDFFRKVGIDLESKRLPSSRANSLDYQALRESPLPPLDAKSLKNLFDPNYINWINRHICITSISKLRSCLLNIPKIGSALGRIGVSDLTLQAYSAYMCLRPIQSYLRLSSATKI